jgi:hypothetical protein
MITKEQITEILYNYAGYIDRSRTERAVHEDNFNDAADEILSKLSQHDVIKNEEAFCEFYTHDIYIEKDGSCFHCGGKNKQTGL